MNSRRPLPPQAILSLNSRDDLIAQARDQEDFAGESSVVESGGCWRFWRIGAALRVVAMLHAEHPALLVEYCRRVDSDRAEEARR